MSEEMKAVQDGIKELGDNIAKKMDEYNAELEKHGKVSTEVTAKIDEMTEKYKSLRNELSDLSERNTTLSASQGVKSIGHQFIDSEAFKAMAENRTERARVEVKNTTINSNLSAFFSDGTTTFPTQRPNPIPADFLPVTIRQRLTEIPTTSNSVNALRETSFTNGAAEVAQGAAKPESTIVFENYNVPIQVVAHWIKVSNQLMRDAPAIASYVDTRMRDGLQQRVDAQLLNGNGTSPNLSGMTDSGNFTAFTPETGANLVDSINKAKYALWAVGNAPDTVIVNPADWSAMEITRESAGTGQYLYGAPGTNAGVSPFGVQIVMSNNMPAGSFLIGNLRSACTLFVNQGVVVEMGYVNDDFTRNLVTIRAEERLGLAVDRPTAILYGDITGS
jgi:HK97 family phage major capsid protein